MLKGLGFGLGTYSLVLVGPVVGLTTSLDRTQYSTEQFG